jgi:hypothetical protein
MSLRSATEDENGGIPLGTVFPQFVIPAHAGFQVRSPPPISLDTRFRGYDGNGRLASRFFIDRLSTQRKPHPSQIFERERHEGHEGFRNCYFSISYLRALLISVVRCPLRLWLRFVALGSSQAPSKIRPVEPSKPLHLPLRFPFFIFPRDGGRKGEQPAIFLFCGRA